MLAGIHAQARPLRWWMRRLPSLEDPLVLADTLAWKPDGLLVLTPDVRPDSTRLGSIPRVFIGGEESPGIPHRVGYDDVAVGRAAARHLLDKGIRSALCISNSESGIALARSEGFHELLTPIGLGSVETLDEITFRDASLHPHLPWAAPPPRLLELLRTLPRPLGVYGWNDRLCGWLLDICHQQRLAVPEDLLVVGTDDDPIYCEMTPPPLSSVPMPFHEAGQRGAEMLCDLIRGINVPRRVVFPLLGEVTSRDSTARLPDDDHRIRYLLELLAQPRTFGMRTDQICAELGCNRRSLERAVRNTLHRSILDLRQQARLKHARELLVLGNPTIEAVAQACGFQSLNSLETLFRRHLNLTPAQYRSQYRARFRTG